MGWPGGQKRNPTPEHSCSPATTSTLFVCCIRRPRRSPLRLRQSFAHTQVVSRVPSRSLFVCCVSSWSRRNDDDDASVAKMKAAEEALESKEKATQ
ncbi:hypothetical protein ACOSP7_022446 [Xanthoceras sorbifolium]